MIRHTTLRAVMDEDDRRRARAPARERELIRLSIIRGYRMALADVHKDPRSHMGIQQMVDRFREMNK